MLEKMSYQQRLVLATVISGVLVVFYELFFAPKPSTIDNNKTSNTAITKQEIQNNSTIKPNTEIAQTPLATSATEIIAKVKSNKFEI
jgi:hypothetical protein